MLANGLTYVRWLRQHCDGGDDILNYVVFDGLYIVRSSGSMWLSQ